MCTYCNSKLYHVAGDPSHKHGALFACRACGTTERLYLATVASSARQVVSLPSKGIASLVLA